MGGLVPALVLSLAVLRIPSPLSDGASPHCGPSIQGLSWLLHDPGRRVRALTPRLAEALESGARRSWTFQRLLQTLQVKDVIVQILDGPDLRRPLDARLTIVPVPGEVRFVRVQVASHREGNGLVALLGHELVHALEVASASQVRDAETLEALYRRIGFGVGPPRQYDSHAANDVERQILRELEGKDGCRPPFKTERRGRARGRQPK